MSVKSAQELADTLKYTHQELRKKCQKGGDIAQVWTSHCSDVALLKRYSSAMVTLATQHWEEKAKIDKHSSRIQWTYQSLLEYFLGGGETKAAEKELRKVEFLMPHLISTNKTETLAKCYNAKKTSTDCSRQKEEECNCVCFENHADVIPKEVSHTTELKDNLHMAIASPTATESQENARETKSVTTQLCDLQSSQISLQVLDVGSCYGPFSHLPHLQVTALDLHPASQDVYQCDFLNVDIMPAPFSQEERDSLAIDGTMVAPAIPPFVSVPLSEGPGAGHITALPALSYDAVIFCLLLEYLPTPSLRLECCRRAHALLRPSGALAVVTPDSKHAGHNAPLYRCWQATLAMVGFTRFKYEKSEHFHGMIFRKGVYPEVWHGDGEKILEEIRQKKNSVDTRTAAGRRLARQLSSLFPDGECEGLLIPQDLRSDEDDDAPATGRGKRKRTSSM